MSFLSVSVRVSLLKKKRVSECKKKKECQSVTIKHMKEKEDIIHFIS